MVTMSTFRRQTAAVVVAAWLALSVLVIGASSALAGTSGGNLTCYNYRTVVVWSRASVWIEHNWSSGSKSWYNPYRQLRESYTGQAQTWWGVEWDFEHDGSGAYCTL